jgi:hypothetical protein
MFRFDALFSNLNTYVPGVSTFPGICTGALMLIRVSLFHSSAIAGWIAAVISPTAAPNHHFVILTFMSSILSVVFAASQIFNGATQGKTHLLHQSVGDENWGLTKKEAMRMLVRCQKHQHLRRHRCGFNEEVWGTRQ